VDNDPPGDNLIDVICAGGGTHGIEWLSQDPLKAWRALRSRAADEVYPADLAALTDDSGAADPQAVKTWFDHKGFGDSNARQMAATYVMIAAKQIPEPVVAEPKKAGAKKAAPRKATASTPRTTTTPDPVPAAAAPVQPTPSSGAGPNVHLDIQIHIPADASAEQIDQIFESMARHLYKQ
jgi:hypothetical protein